MVVSQRHDMQIWSKTVSFVVVLGFLMSPRYLMYLPNVLTRTDESMHNILHASLPWL